MIKYELINYCEFDKYAAKSFSLIHDEPENKNLGDITKVNEKELADFNMMVFGFPCQPFSQAGKMKGFEDERGNMFFEAYRILKEKLPKLFIFENVTGLLSNDKGKTIEIILTQLGKLQYEITMNLLNSKNFGIPQNRLRLFCIGRRIDCGK
jgi:DNA (cytosine-5)-methyltransferase 1